MVGNGDQSVWLFAVLRLLCVCAVCACAACAHARVACSVCLASEPRLTHTDTEREVTHSRRKGGGGQ